MLALIMRLNESVRHYSPEGCQQRCGILIFEAVE